MNHEPASRVYKSKWYLARGAGGKRIVLLKFGAFDSYTQASNFMDEPDPVQGDPRFVRMHKKGEFMGIFPSNGERILKFPNVYVVVENKEKSCEDTD